MMFEKSKKTKKPGGFETMTDKALEKFEDIVRRRDEMNVKARETGQKAEAEIKRIDAKIEELSDRAAKITAGYRDALREEREKQAALIREASVTEEDVKERRVSVHEFQIAGKRRQEIEAESKTAAAEKLAPIAKAIREVRREIIELRLNRAESELKSAHAYQDTAESLHVSLNFFIKTLEERGVRGPRVASANELLKEAKNEHFLAKGGVLFHAKTWEKLKTVEEVEAIELDPVFKPEHKANLDALVEDIRKVGGFEWITVYYVPSQAFGREAGSFWWSHRPKGL